MGYLILILRILDESDIQILVLQMCSQIYVFISTNLNPQREMMEYDVGIVMGDMAGLTTEY